MEKKPSFTKKRFISIKAIAYVMAVMITAIPLSGIHAFAEEGTGGDTGNVNRAVTPTYTITIPAAIDFGDCEKKMANDTEINKIKTVSLALEANTSNLFESKKKMEVSIVCDFKLTNGENALNFILKDGEKTITSDETVLTVNPTIADTDLVTKKTFTASLDQSQIKVSGDYKGAVTFTVAIADNN